MNHKKYHLLFMGVVGNIKAFRHKMAKKGIKDSLVEEMLNKAPVIIKQNVNLETARRYADILTEMGGKVTILEQSLSMGRMGENEALRPMSEFFPCPRCGLVQPQGEVCPRCGLNLVGHHNSGENSVASDRT